MHSIQHVGGGGGGGDKGTGGAPVTQKMLSLGGGGC